jgi:hypothetical protein
VTLVGWCYYQIVQFFYNGDAEAPFQKNNWRDDCFKLILIDERKVMRPVQRRVLRNSLDMAIKLARIPEMMAYDNARPQPYVSGLAVYDQIMKVLADHKSFPASDLETLTYRCQVLTNDGLPLIEVKRQAAAGFCRKVAGWGLPGSEHLTRAAAFYESEVKILKGATNIMPLTYSPLEEKLKMADPAFRRELICMTEEAKQYESQAIECLEDAFFVLNQDRAS